MWFALLAVFSICAMLAPAPCPPQKRFKRAKSPMNYGICCPISNDIIVAKDLQQIRADESEINRRIASFIGRKREEINNGNVHDFITDTADDADMRCARVNSTVHRLNGSKGHLKVHRVKNEFGPQTTNYKTALDKLMDGNSTTVMTTTVIIKPDPDKPAKPLSSGIEERLVNAEAHLNINDSNKATKSIFERLKAVEDRILYLETLSPEYSHFLVSFFVPLLFHSTSNFLLYWNFMTIFFVSS